MVAVEDRGYQFADGVYEVCEVRGGRLVDEGRHMARLARSLGELRIVRPMSPAALGVVLRETIRRNRVRDGIVYVQVTRGVARRDFPFPAADTRPSLVVTARNNDLGRLEQVAAEGIAVVTVPDIRWKRVDIKTVALLPNVLAKQAAREQGAREAWLVDAQGLVTEGASSNAWIVSRDGKLITMEGDYDHIVNRGSLCVKGISMFATHASPNRLQTPRYRAPGSDHWEDISWDDAIMRVAQKIRKTRDATWIATEKVGDKEVPVNRTDAIGFLGGAQNTNEECYLFQKAARLLGLAYVEHQARL